MNWFPWPKKPVSRSPRIPTIRRCRWSARNHACTARATARVVASVNVSAAQLRRALELSPNYAKAHNNLGLALANSGGRWPEAIAEYQAALRINPDLAQVHFNLGNALSQLPGR